MKPILIQLARLLGALVGLYGVILAFSFALVPSDHVAARLDTAQAAASLFITEPKYVFMARGQLDSPVDKVVLLGASNVMAGFKQEQVQALLPNVEVHNLAVGGSNIKQVGQVVDLIHEVQSPAARQHTEYVIGLWYGLFAADSARWNTPDRVPGDTDIDIERYRYGFYRRSPQGAVPLVPARYLSLGTFLIHPCLVLDRSVRDATQSVRGLLSGKPKPLTDEQRNRAVVSPAEQAKYLAFWRDYMGGADSVSEASFRTLEQVVGSVVQGGGRVLLVDLPIPAWHSRGSELWGRYRARMDQELAHLQAQPGVSVARMNDANDDLDFRDEVHPKPRVAELWAQQLAKSLGPALVRADNQPEHPGLGGTGSLENAKEANDDDPRMLRQAHANLP